MKKSLSILLTVVMLLTGFTGFAHARIENDPIIEFECEVLELVLKLSLGLYNSDIRQSHALMLDELHYGAGSFTGEDVDPHPDNDPITSLKGLEHFTNLKYLNLGRNLISDLGPLRNLTSLETLILEKKPNKGYFTP